MTAPKLTWRVQPAPTGRYSSFQRRGWPSASWPDGRVAAYIDCEDDYTPGRARGARPHAPLRVRIADWSCRTTDGRVTFEWRLLVKRCATLPEAKALAQRALAQRPQFFPPVD